MLHSWIRNDASISGVLEFWGGSNAQEQEINMPVCSQVKQPTSAKPERKQVTRMLLQNWIKGRKGAELLPCKPLNSLPPQSTKGQQWMNYSGPWICSSEKYTNKNLVGFSFSSSFPCFIEACLHFHQAHFFCSPCFLQQPFRKRNMNETSGKVVLDGCLSGHYRVYSLISYKPTGFKMSFISIVCICFSPALYLN